MSDTLPHHLLILLTTPWPNENDLTIGDTLYPRDFVASLLPGKEYMGPKKIFCPEDEDEETPYIVIIGGEKSGRKLKADFLDKISEDGPDEEVLPKEFTEAVADFLITGTANGIYNGGEQDPEEEIINIEINSEDRDELRDREKAKKCVSWLISHWQNMHRGPEKEEVEKFFWKRIRTCWPHLPYNEGGMSNIREALFADGRTFMNRSENASYVIRTNQGLDEDEILDQLQQARDNSIFCDVPESLGMAVADYLVTGAIRKLRGQGEKHHTMLINTGFLANDHNRLKKKVQDLIDHWHRSMRYNTDPDHPKIWDLMKKRFSLIKDNLVHSSHEWEEVRSELDPSSPGSFFDQLADVASINYNSEDQLEYLRKAEDGGLKIIAVGGNRLARGLTLEGLTVSYFIRTSRNYDTLLQMGRWFGYPTGYDDLIRLHTTERIVQWFQHLAGVEEQVRSDISRYETLVPTRTPRDLAVRIMTHPDMNVSGRIVSDDVRTITCGYDGEILLTNQLNNRTDIRKSNWDHGSDLFKEINSDPDMTRDGMSLWRNVGSDWILRFLNGYRTVSNLRESPNTFSSPDVCRYIETLFQRGELENWSFAITTPSESRGQKEVDFGGRRLKTVKRSGPNGVIGRLLTGDNIVAMDLDGYEDGEFNSNSTKKMFEARDKGTGLMLAHLIDKDSHSDKYGNLFDDTSQHGLALAIVLPDSNAGFRLRREYMALAGMAYRPSDNYE